MLKIGITGSIGSGKTTVCRIFELLGIPVYYADDAAKKLMVENEQLKSNINQLFEGKAYLVDGMLDRKHIASIVFNDKKKLAKLNALVHPAVAQDTLAWHAKQDADYTLKEAALMVESGSHEFLDKLIFVDAPLELRISRVMQRDNVKREEVLARESKQLSPEEKKKFSDYTIDNSGSDLIKQILSVHRSILNIKS